MGYVTIEGVEYKQVGNEGPRFCADCDMNAERCPRPLPCGKDNILKRVTPPLDIKPKHIHDLHRMQDLVSAMKRWADKGEWWPIEWVHELSDLREQAEEWEEV